MGQVGHIFFVTKVNVDLSRYIPGDLMNETDSLNYSKLVKSGQGVQTPSLGGSKIPMGL